MYEALHRFFGRHADLALVIGVAGILMILFTPIPAPLLDLLLIVNFAFGITILLLTFYVEKPVEFSTFPSLLLVATLFRLALNIAATRLILSEAHGGEVIGAIGEFVVQGNFVIGLIVFFILVVVQYVVVTSGAQRVSEVAARFVLDAMPGHQMSIDADLNMGLIDQEEAKTRRAALEKEAAFYGSMDGASKFVKGDAIAGIIILLINIVGGWIIGVAQMNMSLSQAAQTFTLLTIGDGIVTQVPALVVSVATGIIVTRSSADRQLSGEVLRQLAAFPKIQLLVFAALVGLLALPGMPKWPIAIVLAALALTLWATRARARALAQATDAPATDTADAAASDAVEPLEVLLGQRLAQAWLQPRDALSDKVAAFRAQYHADMGLKLPELMLRESKKLPLSHYEIRLFGSRHGQAELMPERTLAIRGQSAAAVAVPGTPTQDPAFGLPALWIEEAHTELARERGYTLVEPATVLCTHLFEVIKANAGVLITRATTTAMLDGVRSRQPGLVEELVPNVLAVSDVQRVLQHLVAEGVSIRNIDLIVETLVETGRNQKDPQLLAESTRQRLGYAICHALRGDRDALAVLTLDPGLEAAITQNLGDAAQGGTKAGGFVIEPRLAEPLLLRLMNQAEAMMRQNLMPVLLCGPDIRRHLKNFTRRSVPRLAVLSVAEVPYQVDLKSFSVVALDGAQGT
jgi:flagellar biosynthesis protein FlhA